MSLGAILLAVGPALGFGLGVGQIRRGQRSIGAAICAACVAVVIVAAVAGNLRPLLSLSAWALMIAAFIADADRRRAVALGCFSAAFMLLIIVGLYV